MEGKQNSRYICFTIHQFFFYCSICAQALFVPYFLFIHSPNAIVEFFLGPETMTRMQTITDTRTVVDIKTVALSCRSHSCKQRRQNDLDISHSPVNQSLYSFFISTKIFQKSKTCLPDSKRTIFIVLTYLIFLHKQRCNMTMAGETYQIVIESVLNRPVRVPLRLARALFQAKLV